MRRRSRAQEAGGELKLQVSKDSSQRVGCSTVGGTEAGKVLRFDIFFRLSAPSCSMGLVAVCAFRHLLEK